MKTIADNIKPILALIVVLMTYFIFTVILFRYSNDNNAISQVIIAVVGGFGVMTGYYFGYSQGSSKKDEALSQIATNASQPTVQNADNVQIDQSKG